MSSTTRILIVEDDELVARQLALRLESMGYEISGCVADAPSASASASADALPPDLALIDIMLGEREDGIVVSQQMQDRDIPALFLTAYADEALFARARITSPYAYLLKPYNDRELQLAIELALQRHGEERRQLAVLRSRHEGELAGKRLQIEQLLALLTAVVEGSTDSIFAKDHDGCYILCNHGIEVLLGRPRELILGKTDHDLFPAEEAARFRADDERVKAAREALTYEEVVTGADGPRTFHTTKGGLHIHGELRGVFGIARDISERKAAERRIQRLSGFYNALAQTGQAIAHAGNTDALLAQCCEILVRLGQVGGAWIGFLDDEGWIRAEASDGLAQDYLAEVRVSIDGGRPEGRCQTGLAMRDERPTVFNDFLADPRAVPWHDAARAAGVRASAAVPIRRQGVVAGALTVYAGEVDFFDDELTDLLGELASDIAFALDSLDRDKKRQEAESRLLAAKEQLQILSARLIDIQEAERRSLARDLHDDLGQLMTMLKITLHAALAAHPDDADLTQAGSLADRSLQRIRAMSFALRPPQLDDLGLVPALRAHLEATCDKSGVKPSISVRDMPDRLPENVTIACFRIMQEALTNVIRHAKARAVTLTLKGSADAVELTLIDDGAGFDVDEAITRAGQGRSLGVISMQERAHLAGGELTLRSGQGGSEVRLSIPLSPARP